MVGFEIIEVNRLSGEECHIYTIQLAGKDRTEFEQFVNDYINDFENEVIDIYNRLKFIGKETGAREQFFKLNEGKPGDLVVALFDSPDKKLRLYCIRFSKVALIIGGGGRKAVRTWQDDIQLCQSVRLMMNVSKIIYEAILDKYLKIDADGRLIGKTKFEEYE